MTPEQVLTFANSDAMRKNAQKLARPAAWLSLNASERAVWGEIKGSGAAPYQVRFDLLDSGYKCSCPSQIHPCKHAVALMLLYADAPSAFLLDAQPPWVTTWLSARDARAAKKAENPTGEIADPAAQNKRIAERELKVSAGIDALDLWLRDLMRGGLDGLPGQKSAFWDALAARMVDAQARGLANQLQEMSKLPRTGAGWAGKLLERAGMLYLLLEGYRHQHTLPPDLRADIRTIVGWNQKQEDLHDLPAVTDQWLVLSQRIHDEDRGEIQRTWLRGLTTRQNALLLDYSFNGRPFELKLPGGSCFEGDLIYYPSHYPQRAIIKERRKTVPTQNMLAGETIPALLTAYAEALSRQPWLNLFPMLLRDVYPLRGESGWIVRDADGHALSIGQYVENGWKLLALSGGYPLTLFGEWDGQRLLTLSAWVNGRMLLL
ncbi:MAG: SWIM zinc finger family protein [Chloroflexi bacterium]|nr:SWIM zinc finger family protein [Chloroflexota bacterium]